MQKLSLKQKIIMGLVFFIIMMWILIGIGVIKLNS